MERMGPEEFDQQEPSALGKITGPGAGFIGFLLVLAWAMTSAWDYSDQLDREAEMKAERAALVQAHLEALNKFSHPCQATVAQGLTSVSMSPERCVTVAEGK